MAAQPGGREFAFATVGHVYWVQQGGERRDCVAVHTTFTEGGDTGKVWRLREA